MGEKAIKGKAITKVLSCFVIFLILTSAIPFSVLASNSSDDVMDNALDSLSEVDTHEEGVVSGVDNVTNKAGYNLSDSNITGNASNSSDEAITQEKVVASGFADVVSMESSTYLTVIVKSPANSAITPDTAILYDSGWNEIKRLNPTSNAYTFTGLDAGTYHTEAYKDNMFIGSAENIYLRAGVCQIAYITTLYKRNLEVKVCYKDGSTPVVGATVKVYSWDGHNEKWDYEYKGTTNSQGKVTFSSWPTSCSGEKYKLVVEHNSYSKTKEPVFVNKDSGSSYEIRLESLSGDVDYSALIKCISSETDFYNIYSKSFFDGTWWNTKARTEMGSVWNTLVITSAKSGAQTAIVLKNIGTISKVLGSNAFTAVSFIFNVADIIKTTLKAVGYSQIGASIKLAAYKSNLLSECAYLIENGNNLKAALSENDESRIESLLEERAYLTKDIYADLSAFDDDACFYLKNPIAGPATFPSWKYAMIHETTGALRCQLQLDYLVTISELNNLTGEDYNPFLHEECPEGKIKPQRLDNTPLKAWCFGCLDHAGDTDNFIVKVPKSSLPLFLEICTAYNLTFELKGNGVDIKKDKFLETPISEGTYTLTVICKGCPQAYSFYAISGVKYTYAIAPDIQPAEGPCIEYPSPSLWFDTEFDTDKDSITLGEEVTVEAIFKNKGGTSAWQSIAISSPDIENTESYTILDSDLDYCEKYGIGYEAGYNYGNTTKPLKYPLIEGANNNWEGGLTGGVTLKIKPEKEGVLRIYAKSVAYGSGVWRSAPGIFETHTKDQQNEYVYVKEVNVTGGGDTTPPETKCILSPSPPNGENGWYITQVTVTLESTDDSSGIDGIKYYRIDSGSWQTYPGSKVSFTVSEEGGHVIIYYAKDKAGNEGERKISIFYIDKTEPSASISINNGAKSTNSRSVTLYLSCSDAISGVSACKCRYKNEGGSWTSWESCSSTKSWTLTAGEETKKVYYQVKDWAGNIKEVYDTIILKQEEPKLCTSPDPPSHDFGIVSKGNWTWSFEIRNCGSGMLTWSVSDDKDWITVYPTSGSTTTETDTVTVTIDIESCMYLSPGTHTGHVTITSNGGSKTGTITVIRENQPPTNPTLTPDKSSPQLAGTTIKWTASATDPDGDQLYYEFWLTGPATENSWKIVRSWSTDNIWTWSTTSDDVGESDICVWIRDGHHASTGGYDLQKIYWNYEITGKQRPTAKIDSITPNPATQDKDTVHFKGHGTDTDGYIVEYYWTSSINGFMSSSKEFTKTASELSVGTHTIYFKVKDNDGQWSDWDTATLTIKKSSASNYKLDEYGVIQQEYNDDSGINRAAPPATDAMVLAPYIDLIPYGSVSSKVKVEIGITDGQVTEYDPTGNAILSSGRSKLTWSNQDVTNDYHAELFYEADFRHTREVEAKIIPDQLKAEVRNIASYPLYNIIVLYPDSGYWRYATIDYLGVGAKKTVTLSSKKSPDSLVNTLYDYLEDALNDVGLVAKQHRNDWLSGWVGYWVGIGFGSTYQPRVIYRLHQNQYEQYFTCSASPEPSKGMVRVGFVELFNVPTTSDQTKCKVPITSDSSLQDRPSIVYANGYYYVAYQSWEKGRGIFIKKFDSQWNFKKEKEVVSGSAYYDSPSLVFANNKLYVAYVSNEKGANANDYDVIVKEYDPSSLSCTKGAKYLTSLQSCQDLPSLLYKDGYFYLAYQSWEKGNGDIFIKKFDSSWNPIKKVPVTSKSSYQDRPSIIYANGYFYVAYFSKETGNYDIFVKRLDSNLNLDSWKKQITSESSSQSYPFITFVNNEYTIVYASNEGGTLGIYMKKYNSNWNFIGKTKVVDDSSANERRPSHVWDGSNYWVAYVYNYGESNDWNIFAIIPGCEGGSVPAPTPSPSCCPSMTISTGQDTYMPGDNVYVSITLTGRSGCTFRLNSPSIVSLIAPTGETVTQTDMAQGITSSIAPGGHHTIGRSMKLPLNAPLGRYDVKVSLSGGKCTETANGLFHVITV